MTDIVKQLCDPNVISMTVRLEAVETIGHLRFAVSAVNEVNERLHEELADVRADAVLLRAEIERLRGYVETLKISQSSAVVNELNDEIKQLRESCIKIALDKDVINERLRAALRGLLDEVMCFSVDPPSAALNHAIEEARRALEPKP